MDSPALLRLRPTLRSVGSLWTLLVFQRYARGSSGPRPPSGAPTPAPPKTAGVKIRRWADPPVVVPSKTNTPIAKSTETVPTAVAPSGRSGILGAVADGMLHGVGWAFGQRAVDALMGPRSVEVVHTNSDDHGGGSAGDAGAGHGLSSPTSGTEANNGDFADPSLDSMNASQDPEEHERQSQDAWDSWTGGGDDGQDDGGGGGWFDDMS
eukprot:GHVT01080995.1.p1 GENE.GHVT01080995.1~~GHVT01080995.1.p1  ORF type:complete len:209 (-),score=31.05 GHVT01080995.1:420-1046(-)